MLDFSPVGAFLGAFSVRAAAARLDALTLAALAGSRPPFGLAITPTHEEGGGAGIQIVSTRRQARQAGCRGAERNCN